MNALITDRLRISDHFLRRWMDRVENLDIEEQAEAHFNKPRHRIADGEWIGFLQSRGVNTTRWKCEVSRTIGAVPASGEVVVGVWRVLTRKGVAITVKHTSEAR